MLYKSIRWRIQAWHSVLLLALIAGMLGAFYAYERAERWRAIDSQLQALLTPLLPRLRPPGGPEFDREPRPGVEGGPVQARPGAPSGFERGPFYYCAWLPHNELLGRSATAPALSMPRRSDFSKPQSIRARGEYRELVYFGPDGDCVIVGTSTTQTAAELRRLAWGLAGIGISLAAFGLAGGWWMAGFALRPIGAISAAARQIAGGDRAARIDVTETESELGQLAEILNHTFNKLDSAFAQQVRFTADASHELRTPVSVILTQTQLALSREREAGDYRESLQTCQRAAERMRALVNSLLELARVDSGEFTLTKEPCNLAAVAADALELVAPLALEKGATLRSSVEPVQIQGDAGRLGQVLVNLLGNAIQHSPQGVEVSLSVRREANAAVLRVSDNGAGISVEALPHIFERFYQADKSRGTNRNGCGLGLAISQAIVRAHGGRIEAESEPGKGASFTVTLPVSG